MIDQTGDDPARGLILIAARKNVLVPEKSAGLGVIRAKPLTSHFEAASWLWMRVIEFLKAAGWVGVGGMGFLKAAGCSRTRLAAHRETDGWVGGWFTAFPWRPAAFGEVTMRSWEKAAS